VYDFTDNECAVSLVACNFHGNEGSFIIVGTAKNQVLQYVLYHVWLESTLPQTFPATKLLSLVVFSDAIFLPFCVIDRASATAARSMSSGRSTMAGHWISCTRYGAAKPITLD
jgi:hypothetical protein